MLTVLGNFEKIKAEMNEARALKTMSEKAIERLYAKSPLDLQKALNQNRFLLNMYSASKTLPVQVGDHIINYKVFASFSKKLKGFQSSISILPDGIVVQYWKPGTLNQGKGVLRLYDISTYFLGFQNIPVAEIKHGQEA
ncbi:hypothetical protein CVD25_00970 [Bacillus canaveralius]|uniref:Uncharacterized protein n=1 Tax=Bacillus canaveralius TaxID=1403243 RepID=A0A2N5GPK2_9BACI|nr:hypothetical protein [Bacillus canaveralius]PLR84638.1 hypothetical protein CU635_06080 [Bacillus canaveralius]PLS00790.1 hypothetical protein CVD25_00970 [Bacillus canaveralius]